MASSTSSSGPGPKQLVGPAQTLAPARPYRRAPVTTMSICRLLWLGCRAAQSLRRPRKPQRLPRSLNSLTRVWGQTGSRPGAPKDLGFASAYVFGAVCPLEGKAAALIMPICNTLAMNHHLCEISSQVAADAHAVVILDRVITSEKCWTTTAER